jgi:hypothetical protein
MHTPADTGRGQKAAGKQIPVVNSAESMFGGEVHGSAVKQSSLLKVGEPCRVSFSVV